MQENRFTRATFLAALVTALCCVSLAAASALPSQPYFLVARDALAASRSLEAAGGRPLHVFPPHVIFAAIDDPRALSAAGPIFAFQGPVDPGAAAQFGEIARLAAEAWNRNVMGIAPLHAEYAVEPPPIMNDARRAENVLPTAALTRSLAAPLGAERHDTSEFMMGKVAVGIFLLESTGAGDPSTENWTAGRASQAISQIQAGLSWWQARDPNAHLTFVYDIHNPANTSYEPINRSSDDEGLWIGQVLGNLGYADSNYYERAFSYLNNIRNGLNTDWAISIWVADSANDADGEFTDGSFAYAYVGGPVMVMTYDNDAYGIGGMGAVTAHESGHLFYAMDEYAGGGTGSEHSGYFDQVNCNAEVGGTTNVPCIMRGQITPYTQGAVCPCTHGQVGHRDSDGDGIEDILDVPPTGTLTPYSPDPAPTGSLTYTGSGSVSRLPNLNTDMSTFSSHPDITLNKIAAAQFRADGGPWQAATATDGAFDEPTEGFTFTATLTAGSHVIEARVRDTAGNYQDPPASDTVTVSGGAGYPTCSLTFPANGATLTGTVLVSATASDDVSVARVEFILDGAVAQEDTAAPYEWYWTTYSIPDGTHQLSARAVDADGHSTSDTITLYLDNATFDDVPTTDPFWPYVEAIARANITSGCSGSPPLYCPVASVTRAQMAKFICIAASKTALNRATPTFSDVPASHLFYGWIERLADSASWGGTAVTGGCRVEGSSKFFCPNNPVTRQQMAKFLCIATGKTAYNRSPATFADVPQTSPFQGWVERLAYGPSWPGGQPVTGGCLVEGANIYFCPYSNVTRKQMAKFLVLAFDIPL